LTALINYIYIFVGKEVSVLQYIGTLIALSNYKGHLLQQTNYCVSRHGYL